MVPEVAHTSQEVEHTKLTQAGGGESTVLRNETMRASLMSAARSWREQGLGFLVRGGGGAEVGSRAFFVADNLYLVGGRTGNFETL